MATETLRPDATGDEENLTGAGDNYLLVDEAVADDETTKVETSGAGHQRDLYNLPASGVGAGTINKITVYIRVRTGQEA